MTPTLYSYAAYLTISIGLTVWVGRTLHRNGRPFLQDVFGARDDLADSVNHLLLVGFYLINLGYIAFALKLAEHVGDATTAVEVLSRKVGLVLVVLGGMHFLNLYVFSRIRRQTTLRHTGRPVPPDGRLATAGAGPESAPPPLPDGPQ